jgi:hypothetical protein
VPDTSRRALLGALGLAAVAGCELDDLRPPEARRTPQPDHDLSVDPDVSLVRAATRQCLSTWRLLAADARPARARRWAPLTRLHLAHLRALGGPLITEVAGDERRASVADVLAAERGLATHLTRAANRADDGRVARLFASMAAAVAQQVAILEAASPDLPAAPRESTGSAEPAELPILGALEVWQEVLAAEHAAVFTYGVIGAQTDPTRTVDLDAARAGHGAHVGRRDRLVAAIAEAGATPVPAATGYRPPAGLETAAGARSQAVDLERRCAAVYAKAVSGTEALERAWAIAALNDAAVRVLAFRGTPERFPGVGEYANR